MRKRRWWLRRQRVPRPVGRAPLYHRVIMEDVAENLAAYRQREAERRAARMSDAPRDA